MRYIIAGKDLVPGTVESDSADLQKYFELGWEVTTTLLEVITYRRLRLYDESDVLVTATGREFLYRNLFPNVITYNEFHPEINRRKIKAIDLVSNQIRRMRLYSDNGSWMDRSRLSLHYFSRYALFYKACFKPEIVGCEKSGPTEAFVGAEKYICICIRRRSHASHRNLPDSYWLELLNSLANRRCYIVGLGVDQLIRHESHAICSLEEFCKLAASPRCECVVGSMTGTIQLAQLVHSNRIIVIDLESSHKWIGEFFPCVLSDCCNFNHVKISFYMYTPSVHEIIADINGSAGESRMWATTYNNRRFKWMIKMHRERRHKLYEFSQQARE